MDQVIDFNIFYGLLLSLTLYPLHFVLICIQYCWLESFSETSQEIYHTLPVFPGF